MSFFNFSSQPDEDNQPEQEPGVVIKHSDLTPENINDAEPAEQIMFLSAILSQCNEIVYHMHHITTHAVDVEELGEDLCDEDGFFVPLSVFYLSSMEEMVHVLLEEVATATDTPLVSEMISMTSNQGELGEEVFDMVAELSVTSNKIHDTWHEYIDFIQFPETDFTRSDIAQRARTTLPNIIALCELFNQQVIALLSSENVQKFAHKSVQEMLKNMITGN